VKPTIALHFCSLFLIGIFLGTDLAQAQATYQQTNLVADVQGRAHHTDRFLINPWGIAFKPGFPFIVADNKSGMATAYDASGSSQLPVGFAIPTPPGDKSRATPTGAGFDFTSSFLVAGTSAQFIFATEDGTISGWCCVDGNFLEVAILAVDNSSQGAVYKGLTILTPDCCAPYLAVTNFNSGLVEPYTNFFAPLSPPGSFTDPHLPAGYAPFGIQTIGKQVFVTYAVQDRAKHDPVSAPGNGIVSIFDLEGNFVRRFVSHGPLNSPWGVVKASPHFGKFSNDILIGNFGDGTITAFDPGTGKFRGRLKNGAGKVITNPGLWALTFGARGTGNPNTLYFTAGSKQERHGLFGAIKVNKRPL
jgi:uncharacterized protein (TIGR03118 family)